MQRKNVVVFLLAGLLVCTCAAALGAGSALAWRVFDVSDRLADLESRAPWSESDRTDFGDVDGDERVPDFSVTDVQGRTWTREALAGRPVVINFWATWCPPCREELPALQRLADEYADEGLVVLLIDVQERESTVRAYLEANNVDLPCVLDESGEVSRRFRVFNLPTNVLIRPDGTIGGRITGWQGADHLRRGIKFIIE